MQTNMKTMKKISFVVIALLVSIASYGQKGTGKTKKIFEEYKKEFAYMDASKELLKMVERGYESKDLYEKLANTFYFTNRMPQAAKWYAELINYTTAVDPENYFKYAMALKGTGDYEKADEMMVKFHQAMPEDSRGELHMKNKDYKEIIDKNSRENTSLTNASFNTKYSDFGVTEHGNNLVFASSRNTKSQDYLWNLEPFLELYSIKKGANAYKEGAVKQIKGKVNTPFHEANAAFAPTGEYMFFTRNNYLNSKLKKSKENVNTLQLFRAKQASGGKWVDIKPVHFNSRNYSVAHPSFNLDGSRLYFSSDMPGSLGSSDIYVAEVSANGTLGEPVNLGSKINTEGQESFPFVNDYGTLFFSSTGHPGLGGLDVFKSDSLDIRVGDSNFDNFKKIVNIGTPVNSSADDFAYYENVQTEDVYFSSNRKGGKGSDDIYTLKMLQPKDCFQLAKGDVRERSSNGIIPAATVSVYNEKGVIIESSKSDKFAEFFFKVKCRTNYKFIASKDGFENDTVKLATNRVEGTENKLQLRPKLIEFVKKNNKIIIRINPIYFDLNKSNIRPDAAIELRKVVNVMNKYPELKIDMGAHTDSRGRDSYNLSLSDRRAQSSISWIISQGVSSARISGRGYGESMLINGCTNDVKCSEADHQLNRRTEFVVTNPEVLDATVVKIY
jgi:outer membrane protein OmpA-like peptidoglycan-associated protein/tetratricopeptide (TPR) repeat protein